MSRYKQWNIEGQTFTVRGLADQVGIHYQSARQRLDTCNTLKELLRPRSHDGSGNTTKIYIIEGKEFTSSVLADELGTNKHTARYRLEKATTIDELYKPINYGTVRDKRYKELTEKDILDQKMFKLAMGVI